MTSICGNNPTGLQTGQKIVVSIRPEQLVAVRDEKNQPANVAIRIAAEVRNRIFLGEHTEYLLHHATLGEFLLLAPRQTEMSEKPLERGEIVHVSCGGEAALVLSEA